MMNDRESEAPAPLTLSVKQTCKALSISRTTVYALLGANALDGVLVGRRRLVTMKSIKRLAKRGSAVGES
jgi:excisionase family DNA binding protein